MIGLDTLPAASGIYLIRCTRSGRGYVGQAVNIRKRVMSHLYEARCGSKLPLHRAIRKHTRDAFTVEAIEQCDAALLCPREEHWVRELGTYGLGGYNCTRGGEANPMTDPEVRWRATSSPEARRRTSERSKARMTTPEARRRISDWSTGYYADPEARRRMSERAKARMTTPEARRQNSERAKAQFGSPEARRQNSERAKAHFANPEARRRASERRKAYMSQPEARRRQSERAKAQMATPEARRRISEWSKSYYTDTEARRRMSERAKAQMTTPEARRQNSERAKAQFGSPEARRRLSEHAKARMAVRVVVRELTDDEYWPRARYAAERGLKKIPDRAEWSKLQANKKTARDDGNRAG